MSLTYSDHTAVRPEDVVVQGDEPVYTPVYARTRRKSKGVPTWMILTPIAVLMLGGLAALALTAGNEADIAPAAAVEPAAPVATAPMIEAPLTPAAPAPVLTTPAPVATPAPAARQTAPVPRAAPAQTRARAPAATVTPRVEAPVEPTGPRPYSATPAPVAPAQTAAPIVVVVPET